MCGYSIWGWGGDGEVTASCLQQYLGKLRRFRHGLEYTIVLNRNLFRRRKQIVTKLSIPKEHVLSKSLVNMQSRSREASITPHRHGVAASL